MTSYFFDRHHRNTTRTTRRILVVPLPDGAGEVMVEVWDRDDRVTAAHRFPDQTTWGVPITPTTDVRA